MMNKKETDVNSKVGGERTNSAELILDHVKERINESGKGTAVPEPDTQKSDVKTTSKDSVFRDLFGDRKYALQLYQAIHPEDTDVTEADIGNVTIKNVFTDQEYNDLGYVDFTKVYNEQVKLHGKTREAVLETIRICKDRNVLSEYLSGREKEVINIMMGLFDQEKAVEQFGNEKKEEGRTEGRAEGRLEGKKEAAINMKAEGLSEGMIAKILDVGLSIVQEWISGTAVVR